MGDPKGFLKVKREGLPYRPVCERVQDHEWVAKLRNEKDSEEQASRCMDCGTPFCHWGCPVCNYIPEWNDLVFHGEWEKAFELLNATNNLPEITGRICPAPCEYACVLGINDESVTIRDNELSIIEWAFNSNYIKPRPPKKRTGKSVAVIGSGPAGLSCADQLNKAGHKVTVFEKDDRPGGILRYGIPDFKLEKKIIDRRINILKKEGIQFILSTNVGTDHKTEKILKNFDAICLSGGSRQPRDLKVEGRELKGIHFAMDYLIQANRVVAGNKIPREELINAKDKKVLIIGGGDTGADCVGTAHRQGASCVMQVEVLGKPAECRTPDFPWPKYPILFKVSTSHEEGGERQWAVLTKKFTGQNGNVKKAHCVKLDFSQKDEKNCPIMKEIPGSEFEIDADLVILAIGFVHPEHNNLLRELKVEFDNRGNVKTGEDYMTSHKGVFAAGDMRRGQSLIVWAISEGRRGAHNIDKYLAGESSLPCL
ncbi:MAG: glutamate synthase subunit beta [Candidatus Omnitrophota bacterium]|nr:glutamate synthase subunit beta [Candidatus Omnitrophota bacterium]